MFVTQNPQVCQNPPTWDQDDLALLIHLSWKVENLVKSHCDLQRVFQQDHFYFLSIIKNLVKSQSGHGKRVFQHDHSVIWQVFWFSKLFNNCYISRVICKGFFSMTTFNFFLFSKISSNHRVVMEKGFFSMTTLWFDKFFDLQSFLMILVLLLLLYI